VAARKMFSRLSGMARVMGWLWAVSADSPGPVRWESPRWGC
jgi:hypothetical protein